MWSETKGNQILRKKKINRLGTVMRPHTSFCHLSSARSCCPHYANAPIKAMSNKEMRCMPNFISLYNIVNYTITWADLQENVLIEQGITSHVFHWSLSLHCYIKEERKRNLNSIIYLCPPSQSHCEDFIFIYSSQHLEDHFWYVFSLPSFLCH